MINAKVHNRENKDLEAVRDITDDVEESEFVPYACMFDPNTILTKNGELLQTLRVKGFTSEELSGGNGDDLRTAVRNAILKHIDSSVYAVWIHTMRRKSDMRAGGEFPDNFSRKLDETWNARNKWESHYVNEMYITIVREGQSADITSVKGFFTGLIPRIDKYIRNKYIDEIITGLDRVTTDLLHELEEYGAKRLTMVERNGVTYSETLEFLEKLINLEERPIVVPDVDLSTFLTSGEISFSFNAMEVRTAEGKRRFGAILTLKEYKESSLAKIDEFMQIPCEIIVTQCCDFIRPQVAQKHFEKLKYYLKVSGDPEVPDISEIRRILSQPNAPTVFSEFQTTVFLIAYSLKELEVHVKMVREALGRLGIVTVREDLKFEECYWAQLPANFEFVCRLEYTDTQHVGGFVNLHNYAAGSSLGSIWGAPISLFYTAIGTPYYLNLHREQIGHTFMAAADESEQRILLHFLLTQARRNPHRLIYMDFHGKGKRLVQKFGGTCVSISPETPPGMCPFTLPDNKQNREFLGMWIATLFDPTGRGVTPEMLEFFNSCIDRMYGLPLEQRTLQSLSAIFAEADPMMASIVSPWIGEGQYAYLFDHPQEQIQPKQNVLAFDVSPIAGDAAQMVPVTSYLLHRASLICDGTPTILVLNEACELLRNPIFAPRIAPWLDYLARQNVLVIATSSNVEALSQDPYSETLFSKTVTQIYLPNDMPDDNYTTLFGLDESEVAVIEAISPEERQFMVKRGDEVAILKLNVDGMDDVLEILRGDKEVVVIHEDPQAALPNIWANAPQLYGAEGNGTR